MSRSPRTALELVHRGWDHLSHQRPLAAWASWQSALRIAPGDPAASQALEHLANALDLPAAARASYRLRSPSDAQRRSRWDEAFRQAGSDLADPDSAANVFSSLIDQDESDADASYNLGLCLAWSGRNVEAIDALDRYVQLLAASDPAAAADAWSLAEVLRHGGGAEHLADELNLTLVLHWPEGQEQAVRWLDSRPEVIPVPQPIDPLTGHVITPGICLFEWLDRPMPTAREGLRADELPRLAALVVVEADRVRFSFPDPYEDADLGRQLRLAFHDRHDVLGQATPHPLSRLDQNVASFRLPAGISIEERTRLSREAVEHYLEDRWVGHPRFGLNGLGPTNWAPGAVSPMVVLGTEHRSSPVHQAKMEGIIRLHEQLAERPWARPLYHGYPFDRLRRRTGLAPMAPDTLDLADLSCASPEELGQLDLSTLDLERLYEAWCSSRVVRGDDGKRRRALAEALFERDKLWALRRDAALATDYLQIATPIDSSVREADDPGPNHAPSLLNERFDELEALAASGTIQATPVDLVRLRIASLREFDDSSDPVHRGAIEPGFLLDALERFGADHRVVFQVLCELGTSTMDDSDALAIAEKALSLAAASGDSLIESLARNVLKWRAARDAGEVE